MSQSTERLTAALDGRYNIERELGAGGMATVYLAQDRKHDRKVAVKVLKPELAAVLGADRFVVEIKTTAALQHPHILPLFDSGEASGFLYYVMPFVDGETLRDKLNRETQLGVDEAVRLTCDIADALHYAHQHGVIHRDIKPENILLQNGRPMVADFGIALAVSAAAGGRMTETGLSLGTPHYMSPEQATAEKDITARSDVYSLASVLYEMLTGNPPHTGATAQQIIMKIITEDARAVTSLRKSVPEHISVALAQALEKLPADRFATAAEFADALKGNSAGTSAMRFASGPRAQRSAGSVGASDATMRRVTIGAVLVAIAAVMFGVWQSSASSADAARVEFTYRPPWTSDESGYLEISRDGQTIAQGFTDGQGEEFVALRKLGSATMTRVAGTDGARDPRISPDGTSIIYVAHGQIRRVPIEGGPYTIVADSMSTSGTAALTDGSVIASGPQGLRRYRGGQPMQQLTTTKPDSGEFAHWYPDVLPGEKSIVFNSYANPLERSNIEAVNIATGERTILVKGAIFGRYSASGHLLFARAGAIFAVRFDPKSLRVWGPELPVVEDVAWSLTDGVSAFAVSDNGTLVYLRASEATVSRRVVWSDRAGNVQQAIPELAGWAEPRASPDGRWIAVTRNEPRREIWLYDNSRRVLSQLTRNPLGVSFGAVWTPDSRAVIFAREAPQYEIFRQSIDGSTPTLVMTSTSDKVPFSISPNGRLVAFNQSGSSPRVRIGDMQTGVSRTANDRAASQNSADFSPDGRWLVFAEYSTGERADVYVQEVADGTSRRGVSADGGDQPLFSRNGREIVYRKGESVYAVPFNPTTGEPGTPSLLFRSQDGGRLWGGRSLGYDVTADGSRFLFVTPVERPGATPNVVVLNWTADLNARVPR